MSQTKTLLELQQDYHDLMDLVSEKAPTIDKAEWWQEAIYFTLGKAVNASGCIIRNVSDADTMHRYNQIIMKINDREITNKYFTLREQLREKYEELAFFVSEDHI